MLSRNQLNSCVISCYANSGRDNEVAARNKKEGGENILCVISNWMQNGNLFTLSFVQKGMQKLTCENVLCFIFLFR